MTKIITVWIIALVCPAIALAETHQTIVPLRQGQISTAQLQRALEDDLHIPSAAIAALPTLDVSVNLTGLNGWLAIRALNGALGDAFQLTVTDGALIIRVDPQKLPADWDQTSDALDRLAEVVAPQAVARQKSRFGLLLPPVVDPRRAMIVLIHGLDGDAADCRPLAELLGRQGYQTAIFTYPAERPLSQSAKLLGDRLAAFHAQFPNMPIDLVTESMGGLIARAYLEGPDYAGGVHRLIMIAPPNGGSAWAPWSIFLKLAVNARQFWNDPQWSPVWMVTQGICQAGRDLRPGSKFLLELNSRPRRQGVKYTIIAGDRPMRYRIEADLVALPGYLIPTRLSTVWGLGQIKGAIQSKVQHLLSTAAVSDGPVPLSSARLAGVGDFQAIPADHVSLYESVDGQPPAAWPIIENRLGQ